jgi:purine-binding chemotaxis protein CheW
MSNENFPPLEDLISEIDRKIDQYPILKGYFETEDGSLAEDQQLSGKRRGNQFIRFSIRKNHFALPLQYALEIMSKPAITPLPNLPGWILGICNVRGEIISVVELAQLLRIERDNFFDRSHLILLQIGNMKVGALVDKIRGIFFDGDPDGPIEKKALSDAAFSKFSDNTFLSGKDKIHLLEVTKLLPVLKTMQ